MESLEDRRVLSTMYSAGGSDNLGSGAEGEDAGDYVPDQVMVRFEPGISSTQQDEFLTAHSATVVQEFQTIDWKLVELVPGRSVTLLDTVNTWADDPLVKYAEPNYVIQSRVIPNDPLFSFQWDLNNIGQTGGTPDADIDAPEAWDIFTGTSNTVVAVIDSGIDYTHPDLIPNMWHNPGEIPFDGLDNDNNGYIDDVYGINPSAGTSDPMDGDGHGTHVAGTIGAAGNNAEGITGINWDVQLMAVKVLDDSGVGTTASIVTGIDYVTMMKDQYNINVLVSNNSYGGYFYSQAEYDAIAAHTGADILFVAAAGNDSSNNDVIPSYPDGYDLDGIVSVAATDVVDDLAWYSNFGVTTVDLAAPGGTLLTSPGWDILSTVPGSQYDYKAGTSMASPHVAGVAALVRGLAPNFDLLDTKQLLLDTVDLLPSLDGNVLTGGRLNAFNALSAVNPAHVTGTVWSDENRNGSIDASEKPIANWTVYMDLDNDGSLDTGEPSAITATDGTYDITAYGGLGTFTVAQVLQPNWEYVSPASGKRSVTISDYGQTISNIDFGNRAIRGGVTGVKWQDLDGDGLHDADEPAMPGIYIYADIDDSGTIAIGEPAAITDANGFYQLENVPPGEWAIREVLNPGWVITYPAAGFHLITVDANSVTPNVDFGNTSATDQGDAPLPYATLLVDNGASHGLLPGFQMGALIDAEPDGLPEANAEGDNLSNLNDEDGVVFLTSLFAGQTATVEVTIATGPYSAGALQGWIDFNGDGDWSDPGEQIIKDRVLDEGPHTVQFVVPEGATVGDSFARFRYGYERNIGPTGPAIAGEVEDYAVLIQKDAPVARDDFYDVNEGSNNNVLDVLSNDLPGSSGVMAITQVTQPANGTVTIASDAMTLLFTPNPGVSSPPDALFTYTINDGTGQTSTANVTVDIIPTVVDPIAVDDAYHQSISEGTAIELRVLDNDLPGINGPITINSTTAPMHGAVTVDPSGDFLVYVPDSSFTPDTVTVDQFQYTVVNSAASPATSTATVTVFKDPRPADSTNVDLNFELKDPSSGAPITSPIQVGDEFQLLVTVQDTRLPTTATSGMYSAYLDVLYDRELVAPVLDPTNPRGFDITYGADYQQIKFGNVDTPGVVDEVGATSTTFDPLGTAPIELFTVTFIANAPGTFDLLGDPADQPIDHPVLYFDPPAPADVNDIRYGFTLPVEIVASGSTSAGGGGSSSDPLDVNLDGSVSPLDALLVINRLNSSAAQSGTSPGGIPTDQLDVNNDAHVTPLDALLVINHLNAIVAGGEGEGEASSVRIAAASSAVALPNLLDDGPSTLTTMDIQPLGQHPSNRVQPAHDRVMSDWALRIGQAASHTAHHQSPNRVADSQMDSLLDDIADDIADVWLNGEGN